MLNKNINLNKKYVLIFGIVCNVALLCYYKYMDFFISNINLLTNSQFNLTQIALPLGISFFTFTQIAYLVDVYRNVANEYQVANYVLFVTFFPHLIAGPIIHHKEMMPQFDRLRNKILNYKNIEKGIFLFAIGLFKKVVLADTVGVWANYGFDIQTPLYFLEAWVTALSFTFQIYFDFSGYTDMALGSALLFNIYLPNNFNSPYKALNIQDFWRRWHITLSRFLRDYIYIPLGGNRQEELRNLFLTFLIGGIWHGAGWTFIIWGVLHGAAMIIQRLWQKLDITMPKLLAWFITFNFINVTWIFFRAKNWESATNVLKGMFGLNGFHFESMKLSLNYILNNNLIFHNWSRTRGYDIRILSYLLFLLIIVLFFKNSQEMVNKFMPNNKNLVFAIVIMIIGILHLSRPTEFLYFNF